MAFRNLDKIKALELAEARRRARRMPDDPEALVGQLTAGHRWRKLKRWFGNRLDLWTKRLERIGKWVTALLVVVGGGVKLYQLMHARSIAPAEQPPASNVASTTVDRVAKPVPPE